MQKQWLLIRSSLCQLKTKFCQKLQRNKLMALRNQLWKMMNCMSTARVTKLIKIIGIFIVICKTRSNRLCQNPNCFPAYLPKTSTFDVTQNEMNFKKIYAHSGFWKHQLTKWQWAMDCTNIRYLKNIQGTFFAFLQNAIRIARKRSEKDGFLKENCARLS